MRWLVLLLLIPVLSGCIERAPPVPEPVTDAHGTVLDPSGIPVAGARVTLVEAKRTTTTAADGSFLLEDVPAGRCTLEVERPGFLIKRGILTCPFVDLEVRLTAEEVRDREVPLPTAEDLNRTPEPPRFTLLGRVVDPDGTPVRYALWNASRDGAVLADGTTDADGRFQALLAGGPVTVAVQAPCRPVVRHDAELDADLDLELHLEHPASGRRVVGIPQLAGVSGPGPGMVTLTWSAVADAERYEVLAGDDVLDLGGARAWSDHTPDDDYRVRAIDGCGTYGGWSAPANPDPAPGNEVPGLATPRDASPAVQTRQYDVLDANGTVVGQKAWRVVTGTGNCCENYVSTTRQGWILDFGGSSLYVSKNEGVSWQRIIPHSVQICGEGAVVPGPGGDIYAMNWEMCLGAGDDGIWTLKYVAADDTWIEGSGPVHAPFFDRPWMTVMTGPHLDAAGRTSSVRSYIFSNINDGLYGQGHVVSGDGVTYLPNPPAADDAAGESIDLPSRLLPDPDADWTQPIVWSYGRSLDAGLGVIDVGLTCQLLDTSEGRGCSRQQLPVRSMQRDGAGRLHAVSFSGGDVVYRTSDDVGRSWDEHRFALPPGVGDILEWDLKAHHGLDRAVVAIHAEVSGGAADFAIVLRDVRGEPTIDRVLRVGASAGTDDSGVAAEGDRYDFMTTGFLPDGRVVLSFTDGEFHPPAVAIELK